MKGDGSLPVDGTSGEYEWEGLISPDKMPYTVNPKQGSNLHEFSLKFQGIVISCNHKLVDYAKFDVFLGNHFLNGFRAQRLLQMFHERSSKGKLTMVGYKGYINTKIRLRKI